jgi:hypothetical protein
MWRNGGSSSDSNSDGFIPSRNYVIISIGARLKLRYNGAKKGAWEIIDSRDWAPATPYREHREKWDPTFTAARHRDHDGIY